MDAAEEAWEAADAAWELEREAYVAYAAAARAAYVAYAAAARAAAWAAQKERFLEIIRVRGDAE